MADFGDDEYQRMFCVEMATVARPVALAAGQAWSAGQVLSVEEL